MLRTLYAGAMMLAVMGAPALAATYTTTFSLPSSGYVDLGPGPLEVQVIGNQTASFVVADSDSQPPPTMAGQRLSTNSQSKTFCQSSHIWGLGFGLGTTVVATQTTCGATSVSAVLAALPSCIPGSSVAPVPTGQPFKCAGLILIAN